MKKIIILSVLCLTYNFSHAQKLISQRNDLIKDKAIYFTYESGKTKFFTTGNFAGREPLKNNHTFALKGNFANLYFYWLNPLKYNISWRDTSYSDYRDKAVKDFFSLFVGQFGSPIPETKSSDVKLMIQKIPQATLDSKDSKKTRLYGIDKNDNFDGYNSLDLMELYLQLRDNEIYIVESEIIHINLLLKELDELDNYNHSNISNEADEIFIKLFEIKNSEEVKNAITYAKEKLTEWEGIFKNIEKSLGKLSSLFDSLKIEADLTMQLYSKKVVTSFSTEVNNNLNSNINIVSKIKPCLDIIENSVKNELTTQKGYVLNSEVTLEKGKVIENEISITEYDFKKDTKEFTKKSTAYSSKIKFIEYDWVIPVVSSGIFYSDATLKGFGVSTDSIGNLTVSEDNLSENTPVFGLFLNLNFDVGSRFFAPVIQLGIDPTKKRPYILLGGGFSIPVASIAITGGRIWSRTASLDKLSIGQVIESTTDLENDIVYHFDIKPKGWYLGLQYNF